MAQKLSKYFGVAADEFAKRGIFNAFLGVDSLLFVDPCRLAVAKAPEFKDARGCIEEYFNNVIALLAASNAVGDLPFQEAVKRLTFKELAGVSLGYSNASSNGSGIGQELATRLAERAREIVHLGIKDPLLFELIGLFVEDFGSDRLSDMAIVILQERFVAFTARVTKELNLQPKGKFEFNSKEYELPLQPNGSKPLILVPKELLNRLPQALDWSEIDKVAQFNEEIRKAWSALFLSAKKRKTGITKAEIRDMLLRNPQNFADLLKVYRESIASNYDFEKDPEGLFSWHDAGQEAAAKDPLEIRMKGPRSTADILQILDAIVKKFKKLVEENRLYEVLYREDGKPRREVYAQRLFYAVADAYCDANGIELSREPNAGNGPVDFKLSAGGRVLVELKLSSNDLMHGYSTQLPAYVKSENANDAIYLILRIGESDAGIKDVLALHEEEIKAGKTRPRIYVIDARPTKPASKR